MARAEDSTSPHGLIGCNFEVRTRDRAAGTRSNPSHTVGSRARVRRSEAVSPFPAASAGRAGGAVARRARRRGRRARGARRRRADREGEADGRRAGDAGRAAVRREGLVVGLREGRHTRYQWFRCDQMGAHCALASRRHEEKPPPRRERRRPHARPRGPRDRLARLDDGGLELDRADRRRSAALASTAQPTISGEAVQGSTLKVDPGHVEPRAGVVQLPVGPLHRARAARAPRSEARPPRRTW